MTINCLSVNQPKAHLLLCCLIEYYYDLMEIQPNQRVMKCLIRYIRVDIYENIKTSKKDKWFNLNPRYDRNDSEYLLFRPQLKKERLVKRFLLAF